MRGNNGRTDVCLVDTRSDYTTGDPGSDNHRDGDVLAGAALTPFDLAYGLSVEIEAQVTTGRGHFYNRAGELLTKWQAVIQALQAGELA